MNNTLIIARQVSMTSIASIDSTLTIGNPTQNPSYLLNVNGRANFNGHLFLSNTQINTDHIPQGSNNLYFTGQNTRNFLSANSNGLSYDSLTGVFSMDLATASTTGALSSGNWNSFNNKVSSQWISSGSDILYNSGNVMILSNLTVVGNITGSNTLTISGMASFNSVLTVDGTIRTNSGLLLPTTGGTPTLLDFYETSLETLTFVPSTLDSGIIVDMPVIFTRIGNIVICSFPPGQLTFGNNDAYLTMTNTIPVRYRPRTNKVYLRPTYDNNSYNSSTFEITQGGIINVYHTEYGTLFTKNRTLTMAGNAGFCLTWINN
jgi:hypothetical protein